jgi:hypothetical protein
MTSVGYRLVKTASLLAFDATAAVHSQTVFGQVWERVCYDRGRWRRFVDPVSFRRPRRRR